MNTLQIQFEHMAEVEWMERYYGVDEWMEHYYGVDTSTPDYPDTIDRDIDPYDRPQYNGYWNYEAIDTDWPIAEYHEPINWDDIPF